MARGVKTDNKKVAEIITSYTLTNSYNKTAKEVGVSANTVKNIINKQKKENPEKFAKICEEKKDKFVEKADKIINKAMDKLEKEIDKGTVPANHLATIIGTMYDKRALAKGESTDNTTFKVDINVVE